MSIGACITVVWIPWYRYQVLVNGVDEYLKISWTRSGSIVVSFPPKYSIAGVVQLMKQNTGRALREKYKLLRERYRDAVGYGRLGIFASTVGLDEETIRRYVWYQEKEDLRQAKLAL